MWPLALPAIALVGCGGGDLPTGERYTTTLATLPVSPVTVGTIRGGGEVTATLARDTLRIEGHFEGLDSPATAAHLHEAIPGLRGPPLFEMAVTPAIAGVVAGVFPLGPLEIESLRAHRFYVQIHSEANPDGAVRGWLWREGRP